MENPVWDDGIPMISVVGDNFCVPYGLEMVVKKKMHGFKKVHYDVYDTSGNLLLQVDGNVWKLQKKRVMRDPSGLPLLTMRCKSFKWKKEWTVSPGESSEENVLFKVEESNPLRLKTRLDVFLEDKKSDKKNHSDFHVNGRFNSLSFKVYRGKSAIAQRRKRSEAAATTTRSSDEDSGDDRKLNDDDDQISVSSSSSFSASAGGGGEIDRSI
ncbi:hypothetical protein LWI29_025555 [Acer saccharum]|uniref:Uncharacterized protein n=1 Tax=Acer saccharum TaxID=4024 RepID=A0AA39VVS9_ACESA|nr:hypothetical protein LWI29_025555 [Acer saccharum]